MSYTSSIWRLCFRQHFFIEFPPGHPYVDIIDNKMDFESKINRLISCVAAKMGIDIGDRLNVNAKKVKFAVTGPLPKDSAFPNFRDFEVRKDPKCDISRSKPIHPFSGGPPLPADCKQDDAEPVKEEREARQILVHPHHPQTGENPLHSMCSWI